MAEPESGIAGGVGEIGERELVLAAGNETIFKTRQTEKSATLHSSLRPYSVVHHVVAAWRARAALVADVAIVRAELLLSLHASPLAPFPWPRSRSTAAS